MMSVIILHAVDFSFSLAASLVGIFFVFVDVFVVPCFSGWMDELTS